MFEVVVEDVMRKRSFRFAMIAIGLGVMLAMPAEYAAAQSQPPTTQVPQPPANDVNWPGAGYGVGALLCNVLYIPAKLTYAVLGGVVGGGTYLVTAGNQTAANTVWRSSLGGDYVVTPQMLAGQQLPARYGSDHDGKLGRCGADNAAAAVRLGLVRECVVGGRPAARSRQRPRDVRIEYRVAAQRRYAASLA